MVRSGAGVPVLAPSPLRRRGGRGGQHSVAYGGAALRPAAWVLAYPVPMRPTSFPAAAALCVLALAFAPNSAEAANILFVADGDADTGIPMALKKMILQEWKKSCKKQQKISA